MSHTSAPTFVLAVGPNAVRIPVQSQAGVYHGVQTVTNYGSAPMVVRESVQRILSGRTAASCTQSGVPWLHANLAASYRLMPRQTVRVPFTVSVQPGQTGTAALIATGSPASKTLHNAHVGGGVATRVQIGNGAQQCHQVAQVIVHAPGGPPLVLIVLLAVVAALLLAGVALVVRRNRRAA